MKLFKTSQPAPGSLTVRLSPWLQEHNNSLKMLSTNYKGSDVIPSMVVPGFDPSTQQQAKVVHHRLYYSFKFKPTVIVNFGVQ